MYFLSVTNVTNGFAGRLTEPRYMRPTIPNSYKCLLPFEKWESCVIQQFYVCGEIVYAIRGCAYCPNVRNANKRSVCFT